MENNKTLVNDLTTGPVFKKLILFALPMMLANLLQAVYSMVDMIIVGQFVGAAGLSAVGIGGQVTMIMLNMCTGFTYGGQILISQQIGKRAHHPRQNKCRGYSSYPRQTSLPSYGSYPPQRRH
ncbi:MAG: hypothetical protein E7430_09700 [Ruminococcaceae bacterium]|nr:hypothetical protein [Oscillospiraceae bacterium]